jgi:hypothetical protein
MDIMEQEIFADGIGSIVLEGGVMRIDLMSVAPGQRDKDNKPQMAFRQRIIMPVEGFINSFKIYQDVIRQMEQSGLITRPRAGTSPAPANTENGEMREQV